MDLKPTTSPSPHFKKKIYIIEVPFALILLRGGAIFSLEFIGMIYRFILKIRIYK